MEKQARNFKKAIAIFTVLCVMFTLVPMNVFAAETTTAKFASDISGHWAKDTIQRWMDQGSIKGYEDGTFRPDNNISRAEFMSLVNEIFNYEAVGTNAFSDVKSTDWFAGAVAKASAAGYITGYPDGTMKPGNPIIRRTRYWYGGNGGNFLKCLVFSMVLGDEIRNCMKMVPGY